MVFYKGRYLAKSSEAFKLHSEGEFKKLDALIKEVDRKYKEMMERY